MPRRNRPSKITKRLPLKKGKVMVIQADDPNHERGLLIELVGKGGYDIAYWYDKPELVFPAEIRVDGRTVAKDGRIVHIGYHPELAQPSSFNSRKRTNQRTNPAFANKPVPVSVTKRIEEIVTKAIKKELGTPEQIAEILLVLAKDVDQETVDEFEDNSLKIHRGKLVYSGTTWDGRTNVPYIQKKDDDY